MRKLNNITYTKTGQKALKVAAKSRVQTLLITSVVPDYLYEHINVDTGRLRSTIRVEKPYDTKNGIAIDTLIGGIEGVSEFASKYGAIYGDTGPGTSRYVDYVAWLDQRNKLDVISGELLDELHVFVDRNFH